MAKIDCMLYHDPIDGYPRSYARDSIPEFKVYPDGQTAPTPKATDFISGQILGSVSGELGLRRYLESLGHTLVVTSDKDGEYTRLDQELPDAEIETGADRRHRFRPCRTAGSDSKQHYRRTPIDAYSTMPTLTGVY